MTYFMNYFICPAGCEVYNLGTGKGTSVLEMVAAFEKTSGKVPAKILEMSELLLNGTLCSFQARFCSSSVHFL